MSDLTRYINKRKSRDKTFAKGFDSGYESSKKDSEFSKLLRDIQNDFQSAGYTQKDIDRATAHVKKKNNRNIH